MTGTTDFIDSPPLTTSPSPVHNSAEGLDAVGLKEQMVTSFKSSFANDWLKIRKYAEEEAQRLTDMLLEIHKLQASGETTEERAKILLSIHKDVENSSLLAIRGLSKAAIDTATHSALAQVKRKVNLALGFELL